MFDQLGITWQSMLFHVIAIIVLVIALFLLLYKPVKRIIADHRKKLDDVFGENEKLNSEALEMKSKYENMITEVKDEAMRVNAEAAKKAEVHAESIVNEAQNKAANILDDAQREALASKQRLDNEFKRSVSKLAVEIAGKVLEREVSEKDNKSIIDAHLSEWEK